LNPLSLYGLKYQPNFEAKIAKRKEELGKILRTNKMKEG
jgi:hypothetical protein